MHVHVSVLWYVLYTMCTASCACFCWLFQCLRVHPLVFSGFSNVCGFACFIFTGFPMFEISVCYFYYLGFFHCFQLCVSRSYSFFRCFDVSVIQKQKNTGQNNKHHETHDLKSTSPGWCRAWRQFQIMVFMVCFVFFNFFGSLCGVLKFFPNSSGSVHRFYWFSQCFQLCVCAPLVLVFAMFRSKTYCGRAPSRGFGTLTENANDN